jgi:hypothetical protein
MVLDRRAILQMSNDSTKRTYRQPALVNYGPIAKLTQPGSPDGGGGGPLIDIMIGMLFG